MVPGLGPAGLPPHHHHHPGFPSPYSPFAASPFGPLTSLHSAAAALGLPPGAAIG